MSTKNKSTKNDNKNIICSFLAINGNMKLPCQESFDKFFAIKENEVIRKDAFRFYHKKVKDGYQLKSSEKIVKEEKPAIKTPTKKEVKAAVAKTKVVKAAKV